MEKYIITQDYFDANPVLEDSDFQVGAIVTQDEENALALATESAKGAHTLGDPVLPPPHPPRIPL